MGILSKNDGGHRESYGEMKARLEKDAENKRKRKERYRLNKETILLGNILPIKSKADEKN